MEPYKELIKAKNLIIIEWISIIAMFLTCFVYLINRIDHHTDNLYKMYVEATKNLSDYRKESDKNAREADSKFYNLLKESKRGNSDT
jgi:hypothetical protein